jgi:uncharacterized coiled-coil DUF342 family protein
MNEELSQDQKAQLSSWASQRDSLLLDIANLRTEHDKLASANKEVAASYTEIVDQINQGLGRLAELNLRESEYEGIVSTEVSKLESEKSKLQSEVVSLQQEIDFLLTERDSIIGLVSNLVSIHNKLSENAINTERMIGHVTEVNSDNVREVENLLVTLKGEVKKIIDVNSQNVDKTNAVITELPRIIFELQRDILERKKFNKTKHT